MLSENNNGDQMSKKKPSWANLSKQISQGKFAGTIFQQEEKLTPDQKEIVDQKLKSNFYLDDGKTFKSP